MKLLVSAGDSILRKSIENTLENSGHDVLYADNFMTALSLLTEKKVNLLITDMFNDGMNSPELIKEVRKLKSDSYIYILMISDESSRENILGGFEAGADDCIRISCLHEDLLLKVKSGCRVIELEDRSKILKKEKVTAESRSTAKGEFLANMSHEIRTPLNGIIGITELALDGELNNESRELMKTVLAESESLLKLVNDVLDFSKIESGKLDLEKSAFNIKRMISDIHKLFSATADKKGLEFISNISEEIPRSLIGDPGRLRQVINNLLGNALKFTHAGSISLDIDIVEKHGDYLKLCFSVSDTGIGIPEDKHDKILERFTQADGSTSRNYGGSGLGTTISKQLAELMGGELAFTSREGEGSRFWFTADFTVDVEYTDNTRSKSGSADAAGAKILIADRNFNERRHLAGLLRGHGYTVTEADNPDRLYDCIKTTESSGSVYDLIIVDFKINGADGFGVSGRIRENKNSKNTRLLLLTSIGKPGDCRLCRESGINGYLTRPFSDNEFTGVVDLVLAGSTESGEKPVTRYHASEESGKECNILLAEDYPTNQKVVMRHLTRAGYSVDLAENGTQAVEMFQLKHYALILMDVQMPGMNGFEATAQIRHLEEKNRKTEPGRPDTVIIAMTAHAMEGYGDECIEAGFNDYISKPARKNTLLRMVSDWLFKTSKKQDNIESIKNSNISSEKNYSKVSEKPINLKKMMEEFQGDKDFIVEVVGDFIDDVSGQVNTIEKALDEKDFEKIRKEAHAVKGGALNISADLLSNTAYELEMAGRSGNLENGPVLLRTIKDELNRLGKFISEIH